MPYLPHRDASNDMCLCELFEFNKPHIFESLSIIRGKYNGNLNILATIGCMNYWCQICHCNVFSTSDGISSMVVCRNWGSNPGPRITGLNALSLRHKALQPVEVVAIMVYQSWTDPTVASYGRGLPMSTHDLSSLTPGEPQAILSRLKLTRISHIPYELLKTLQNVLAWYT